MFPCFDEPGLKAYFDFTVYYKYAEYNANWNMPIKEQGTVKNLKSSLLSITLIAHFQVIVFLLISGQVPYLECLTISMPNTIEV